MTLKVKVVILIVIAKFLSKHIVGWVCSLQGLFCNKTQGSNARL